VTHRSSTPRSKTYSMNIIWPASRDLRVHRSYVWRVRISMTIETCTRLNYLPAGMHKPDQKCNGLIEITANALSGGVVALMLLAVQRDHNLELSINNAIRRWVLLYHGTRMKRNVVSFQGPFRTCARAWEYRRSDKTMHTSVSVALGKS
jgi:hypothetical protein